jgi:hypothetical protein
LILLEDRYGTDIVLYHQARYFKHSLVSSGGQDNLILEKIADQHLHLPWTCVEDLCRKPSLGVQYPIHLQNLDEGSKNSFISGPAAEYMSKKCGWEEQNAGS